MASAFEKPKVWPVAERLTSRVVPRTRSNRKRL